jgi:hypothetical protein
VSVIDDPDPAPAFAAPRPSRGRRIGVGVLLWLATLCAILGILAIWVNRQVLDAENWSETSTKVISDRVVRTELSAFLVNQLYARTDVTSQVRKALPPRLAPLAGPVTGGLRELGEKAVFSLLGLPAAQTIWRRANEQAIRQLDNIVEEKEGAVTSKGDAIILDIRPVLVNIAGRLGLPPSVVDKLPPNAGRITIASSRRVKQVKNLIKLVKGLQIVLPAVAFLLAAAAIWLSKNRRRYALLLSGLVLIGAGVFVLIARNVAGHEITGALAADDSVQHAVHNAYSILTEMLSQIAQSAILFGLAILLSAAVAGPRRWAVAVRRAVAPWLRERPGVSAGVVAAVFGLFVLWAPIPALRMPIPALIMLALLILGVVLLRRQVNVEFPDARIGDTEAAIRAWWRRSRGPASGQAAG